MPTPKWSQLKPHLQRLDKQDLVQLVHDLYALNADNKVFLSSRLLAGTPEEISEPYRRIIRQVFNPDRGMPSFRLSVARKALNDFKKACAEPLLILDLMLFYVEQGVICTNTFGDIDGPFYDSLLSVYASAARLAGEIDDPRLIDPFQHRFDRIVDDTRTIGWGFHDGLRDIYGEMLSRYWDL